VIPLTVVPIFRTLSLSELVNRDDAPPHLINALTMDGSNVSETFPRRAIEACPTLEDAQIDAIKAALSQQVVMIQGPPGTGKVRELFRMY